MLYSFDVFDTVITRKTATPQGIFLLMQRELVNKKSYNDIPEFIRQNFCELRIGAEKMARYHYVRNAIEDIKINEIYEALKTTGFLSDSQVERLISLEKHMELQNVVPIKKNIDEIKRLKSENKSVVLISDMYLDNTFIKTMLLSVDEIFKEIPIYVSSDYLKSKSSGNLYKIVSRKTGSDFGDWKHIGDNVPADILAPQKLGIKVQKYDYEELWSVESNYLKNNRNSYVAQLMIGIARNARLQSNLGEMAYRVGCSVATPILYPYVQWIIKNCQEQKIRRLYFIARDGYVLKKIADIIIEKLGLSINTYYIFGSRRAWRMAAYDGGKESLRQMIAISDPVKITKLSSLADILQIEERELMLYLPEYEFVKNNIAYGVLCQIVHSLVENDKFRRYLVERNMHNREIAIKYLKQEIDCENDDFAFVELRGSGYTTKCLAELMSCIYEKKIKIFYYNLVSLGMTGDSVCYNYIINYLPEGIILELLCRALHGQTNGYYEKKGNIIPVLEREEGEHLLSYGYCDYIAGIEECVKKLSGSLCSFCVENDYRSISTEYIDQVCNMPDKSTLMFFSDMPFYLSSEANEFHVFAPSLDKRAIRDIFLFNRKSTYGGVAMKFSLLRCSDEQSNRISFYNNKANKIEERFQKIYNRPLGTMYEYNILYDKFISESMLGKRCVIYGAGKNGKKLYYLSMLKKCNVVGWLDENYSRMNNIPVTGDVNCVRNKDFDVIVISVVDKDVRLKIKNKLVNLGVEEGKIRFFNTDIWYYYFLYNNIKTKDVIFSGEGIFADKVWNIINDLGCNVIERYETDSEVNDKNRFGGEKRFGQRCMRDVTLVTISASFSDSIKKKKRFLNYGFRGERICVVVELSKLSDGYLNVW